MKNFLLSSCLTLSMLFCSQSNALTLISDVLENQNILQANPQFNDPENMAAQKQSAKCLEEMYKNISQDFSDKYLLEYENILEAAMKKHQYAILTGAAIDKTLKNLIDSFEQLGLYLINKRGATPEIATQYFNIILFISSTVATITLSLDPSINLMEINQEEQQKMQQTEMELSKRLQMMFMNSFGFIPQQA